MHPVPCQHLHDTHPRQYTRRQRIKRSNRNDCTWVVTVELVEHADTDSHADGRDERKDAGHDEFLERGCSCFGELGDAGSEGDALEHLVEEDDDEEGEEERVAGDDEGDADDYNTNQYGDMRRVV